jgi:hypothetical protein
MFPSTVRACQEAAPSGVPPLAEAADVTDIPDDRPAAKLMAETFGSVGAKSLHDHETAAPRAELAVDRAAGIIHSAFQDGFLFSRNAAIPSAASGEPNSRAD